MSRRRRVMRTASLACGAAVLSLLAAAGPAHAYVRYRLASGVPFAWTVGCVYITAYPGDLTDMTSDQVMTAATGAAAAWSNAQNPDAALTLTVIRSSATPGPRAVYDSANRLVFRHDSWCNMSGTTTNCSYDPAALAITSVFAKQDGHIVDSDIEVNAKFFTWTDLDLDPTTSGALKQDLQNALTHEMGHFIGLDHPCFVPGSLQPGAAEPLDNLGNPAPDCSTATPEMMEATMFPSAAPGETSKRTLAADDLLALREIYPATSTAPQACPATPPGGDDGGCRVAGGAGDPGGAPWTAALASLAGVVLFLLARRRSIG